MRRRHLFAAVALLAAMATNAAAGPVEFLAGFIAGYQHRAAHSQDANDLLSVGFTIIDPEGHAIARFDD